MNKDLLPRSTAMLQSSNIYIVGINGLQEDPTDHSGRSKIYLHPGQLFASVKPSAVTTILGSCVALCLWDAKLKIGGVNHFLLPSASDGGTPSTRFGNVALRALLNQLIKLGSQKRNLQAKLFGGACVLDAFQERENHLGARNIQLAQTFLGQQFIPLAGQDLAGRKGRKLIFHTDNGAAWVKYL